MDGLGRGENGQRMVGELHQLCLCLLVGVGVN